MCIKQETVIWLFFLYLSFLFAPSVPSPKKKKKCERIKIYVKKTKTTLRFLHVVFLVCWCLQTFLVRKCSSSQRKVLCFRATADKSASSVKECFICEEDSSEYETSRISTYILHPPLHTHTAFLRSPFEYSAVHTLG